MTVGKLRGELLRLAKYGSALGVLGWDEEVNLPPTGQAYRGEVSALLATDLHAKFTDPKLYKVICSLAEDTSKLNPDERLIVTRTKHDIEQATKLPSSFVERSALLTSKAFGVWVEARKTNDFKKFGSTLAEIIELKKEEAGLIGYKSHIYDALVDEYEPEMSAAKLDALFAPLAAELSQLIMQAAAKPPAELPPARYDIEAQKKLNAEVAGSLGYDLSAGRIDASPHPFTTGFHPTDVRITTRYDETDFWVSLGSVIHEAGHAIYEQGLPIKEFGTPLGEAVSLGIHESQSRGWENFVGRSRAFCSYLYPLLKKYFPHVKYSEEQLYLWLNRVNPNLIRVESDEVTYNMHIILRYELEKSLLSDDLSVNDLPAAWNEKINKYLGLSVDKDANGVLQDVHWSHGSFGYFPTYTLGNIYAAQFFETYKKQAPKYETNFAAGNFGGYLTWLRQNIHEEGRRYQPDELVAKVTGAQPSSKFLLEHLAGKVKLQT